MGILGWLLSFFQMFKEPYPEVYHVKCGTNTHLTSLYETDKFVAGEESIQCWSHVQDVHDYRHAFKVHRSWVREFTRVTESEWLILKDKENPRDY